ncbi:MAG: translation initiation factor IF-2 [Parachlamydiaceae bacterium]
MAKNLKLNIKNTQIAQAVDLGGLKSKLAKKKADSDASTERETPVTKEVRKKVAPATIKEEAPSEAPRIRARSKSAFAEPQASEPKVKVKFPSVEEEVSAPLLATSHLSPRAKLQTDDEVISSRPKTSEELRKEIFGEDLKEATASSSSRFESLRSDEIQPAKEKESILKHLDPVVKHIEPLPSPIQPEEVAIPPLPSATFKVPAEPSIKENKKEISSDLSNRTQKPRVETPSSFPPKSRFAREESRHGDWRSRPSQQRPTAFQETSKAMPTRPPYEKLGPTGKHVNDLLQKAPPPPTEERTRRHEEKPAQRFKDDVAPSSEGATKKDSKSSKAKEFRDVRPSNRKVESQRTFDARDRQGLRSGEDERKGWRKKRLKPQHQHHEDITVRPTSLKVRIPIAIKDLAAEMKLKASQLISKLFMQGVAVTLNDYLDDETTIQLLGHEFGCEIAIDTAEEERLRITDKTIREEIQEADPATLTLRAPIVAFMGHVDHGKTSLIDYIRKSNRAAGEAGAITQHIGAFKCHTAVGDIAILDTPGHEAFSAMRARGADVTDIVVLVVAGDEGIRQQTLEAIQHAKAAKVSIVVALNKCDKPGFDAEQIYRQLAENDLLPEVWGGQVITVNCSAVTGEGISTLLEMLALQAEVLELKACPVTRARGNVLESEMHKGMGAVATVLVQNGTLRLGDALVFGQTWGRVKTMRNEFGEDLKEAGPSTPVEITGLSGLPDAGEEFITVKNEKEAREIAEGRMQDIRQTNLLLKKKLSVENLFQQASDGSSKKILNIVLRADVQGSLEALKVALLKITSTKAELNIIFTGVGEISESDVQLAAASKAVIIGFHTQIESHADSLVKELGVQVRLHDIIYHAIDDVKDILAGLLDKIAVETEKGKAEVRTTFKSSQYGIIAGCQVIEGVVHRNHQARIRRSDEIVWKGTISSLKRIKEDVREVAKGLECGIVLNGFSTYLEGDVIETYEITYIVQEL